MAHFSKFVRPNSPRPGQISSRDLDVLEAVLRFRFSPTSELLRLVSGNHDVTSRRLRTLWEWGLISRFAFPFPRPHSEFIYYISQNSALECLRECGRLSAIHPKMLEEVRLNREAGYDTASTGGQLMKLGFLQHALMLSRLHFMLEQACRRAGDAQTLLSWHHGAELRGHKVEVPLLSSQRVEGTNTFVWQEHDNKTERLPVEADALFTLKVGPDRESHFFYEADRGTMPMADMLKKLRGYYHFIKRQNAHKDAFGKHPIRAVLFETTTEARARKLLELCQHPNVIGAGRRSALFWVTISPMFCDRTDSPGRAPKYLLQPELVFSPIWATPEHTLHSLLDEENDSAKAQSAA